MVNPGTAHTGANGASRGAPARGKAGFFGAGRDAAGRWWLLDPAGGQCFARLVHGVEPIPVSREAAAPGDCAARLRAWGFNAVGVGGARCGEEPPPFLEEVDFAATGPVLIAPGVRLPDVFDPEWAQRLAWRALEVCAPQVENRRLLGWVTDSGLAWGQDLAGGRPTLLQVCLSLEPGFAAYHAAWEFVLALHGGRLESLARAWGVALANKEALRELTRSETGITSRGYGRDHARWTREFARRYFATTAAAVRRVDENHLILGCRFGGPAGPDVLAECTYPAVDVAMPDWRELPAAGLHPVLAGEVGWVTGEFTRAPAGRWAGLTTVERMLRRARLALERMARHPAVVGYGWAQWKDGPGEQPPFARGLLHLNGAEAREHTELLTQFNLRAENLRRHSISSLPV